MLSGVFLQNQDHQAELGLPTGAKVHFGGSTGVDLDYFSPASVNHEALVTLRRDLGLEGRLVLTYVGRLLKERRTGIAGGRRRTPSPRPASRIAGRGYPDPGSTNSIDPESIASSRDGYVRYLGRRDDIREILAATDVFVNPSSYREGVPRANLEALAMGKTGRDGHGSGCRDTVAYGETGLLVPTARTSRTEPRCGQLLESSSLRDRFGGAARVDARKRFSVETAVERVAAVYEAALPAHMSEQ